MVIWISGAYGVGKSTLAEALAPQIENSMIFDAEEVGNAVRENYPGQPYGVVFEDYPLWGEFCYRLIKDLHEHFHKNILVPMTLVRPASYENIISRLMMDGITVHFLVLEASHDNVHDRILARGEEEGCWCMENIEMSRQGSCFPCGYHIDTDGKTAEEVAQAALTYVEQLEFMLDTAQRALETVETPSEWGQPLAYVALSARGNVYTVINNEYEPVLKIMAERGDTVVAKALAMWKGSGVEIPSYGFRKALVDLNGANAKTELLLVSGVKTIEAAMPPKK